MGFRKEDLLNVISDYINALDETDLSEIEVEKVVNRLNHQAFKRAMETATCELLDTFIAYSKSSLDLYKIMGNNSFSLPNPNDVSLSIPHINLGRGKGHTAAIIRHATNEGDLVIVPNHSHKRTLIERMRNERANINVQSLPWVLTVEEVISHRIVYSPFYACRGLNKNISVFIDQYSAIMFMKDDIDKLIGTLNRAVLEPSFSIERIVGLG